MKFKAHMLVEHYIYPAISASQERDELPENAEEDNRETGGASYLSKPRDRAVVVKEFDVPDSFRVTVFPPGEAPLESKCGFSVRVEDKGVDITQNVTALTIHGDMHRQYAEIEVTGREGFEGPFCAPAMPL